jgi:hypothetical protein
MWTRLPPDRQKQIRQLLSQLLARMHAANSRKEADRD